MPKTIPCLILSMSLLAIIGCSGKSDVDASKQEADKNGAKATLVTVTKIKNAPVEMTEEAIGSLESITDPTVAAEIAARVISVNVVIGTQVKQGQLIATLDAADFSMQRNEQLAEVARIQALIDNQSKIVARNQALVSKNFISQNAVDNDTAQQNVLKQQLEAAKARAASINHNSSKSKVYAPVSGTIEKRLAGPGDYLRVGDPIVQIVSSQHLRAHLPFPERIGAVLKAGLKIRLTTPTSPNAVETVIHELKPMITADNRTVDVIADVLDAPGWQAGASVTGTVVLGEQTAAMMIPEQSLILRPAGEVVYVVRDNTAYQAVVKTAVRQNGLIEVLEGLNENDTIVVDGAGFLTDKAPVKISH
jgi:membrane fusion protein, multidrug efflux system